MNGTLEDLASQFRDSPSMKSQIQVLKEIIALGPDPRWLEESCSTHCSSPYVAQMLKGMVSALRSNTAGVKPRTREGTPALAGHIAAVPPVQGDTKLNLPNEVAAEQYVAASEFVWDPDGLDQQVRAIIVMAVRSKLGDSIEGVSIRSLTEGFSGSKVYSIYPIVDGEVMPMPWIIKVGEKDKLFIESRNIQQAKLQVNCTEADLVSSGDLACIIQKVASNHSSFPEPLQKKVWPTLRSLKEGNIYDFNDLSLMIEQVDSQLSSLMARRSTNESIFDLLAPVAEQIKVERLFARLAFFDITGVSSHLEQPYITSKGPILDPLFYYELLRKKSPFLNAERRFLHGDLHSNNVQVDSRKNVHFIDWGNSGSGHFLIDYATLETSVLAHCLPNGFMLDSIEWLLDSLDSPTRFTDQNNPVHRIGYTISCIRQKAKRTSDLYSDFQYGVCLFFCGLQQLQYEDSAMLPMLTQVSHAIRRLEAEWGYLG